ncbi:MAG: hypothetical protein JJU00_00035 [Opitutales bacterium]|nr:hypothetical protein [Opitutales bacterium]
MKPVLKAIAYLCLLGILTAGILFAAGRISGPALNTTALILTVGWFALRLIAAGATDPREDPDNAQP